MDRIVNQVFVLLDETNVVIQAIEVALDATVDGEGNIDEAVGASFCQQFAEGTWLWSDPAGGVRRNHAGIGYTYDSELDAFIPPKPHPEAVLDGATCQWLISGMTLVDYLRSSRQP